MNNKSIEKNYRVNNQIRSRVVRLVGDNIENPGVYPIEKALSMAEQMELDLVEISPNTDPPVCKIIDFQKFLYQQKKKQKEIKSKTAKVIVKEIRFSPYTDEHDYNFKLKHVQKFLEEGSKVKIQVFFKGRSIMYSKDGEALLKKIINDIEEIAKVEQDIKLEGKRMSIMVVPKIQKKK